MLHENYDVARLHDLTKIDPWFLHKLYNIVDVQHELENIGSLFGLRKELLVKAKQKGFSDLQISKCLGCSEDAVRERRLSFDVRPFVKRIDTVSNLCTSIYVDHR